jgi:hypothetical protein
MAFRNLLIVIALALAAWVLAFLIADSRQQFTFRSLLIVIALALAAWALTLLPPDFKPPPVFIWRG